MNEPHTIESPQAARPRPRWRRRLFVAMLLLVVIGSGLLAFGFWYMSREAELQLSAAIAEADALDPGWHWDEVEARRATIPDEENGARCASTVTSLLPKTWPPQRSVIDARTGLTEQVSIDKPLTDLSPEVQLDEALSAQVCEALATVAPAVTRARPLLDLSQGRFPLQVSPDFASTRMDHVQATRALVRLFQLQAALEAQAGRPDDALRSARGGINAGRSVGDEPITIAQLCRLAVVGVAVQTVERVLAQGEPSEETLRATQELLEREAQEQPGLLVQALRGERAGWHLMLENLNRGVFPVTNLSGTSSSWEGVLDDHLLAARLQQEHGPLLRVMTEGVEIAKLPLEKQAPRVLAYDVALRRSELRSVHLLLVGTAKVFRAFHRNQAALRTAITAVAAERYRRAEGHCPSTLAQLCPKYLNAVPVDPYGDGPLRLVSLQDHLVIYSVGVDGVDNGGRLPRRGEKANDPGMDIGFRLWAVDRRRQPPPPTEQPAASEAARD
jgi:hypothetical protein